MTEDPVAVDSATGWALNPRFPCQLDTPEESELCYLRRTTALFECAYQPATCPFHGSLPLGKDGRTPGMAREGKGPGPAAPVNPPTQAGLDWGEV